jgi:hypothetical protein
VVARQPLGTMPTVDPTPHPPSKYLVAYRAHRRRTWWTFAGLLVGTIVASSVVVLLSRRGIPGTVAVAWCCGLAALVVAFLGVESTLAFAHGQANDLDVLEQQRMQMQMERDLCERDLAQYERLSIRAGLAAAHEDEGETDA